MHVVFRHDRDVVSKNPAGGVDPRRAAAWAWRQGVFLLVIFSLHKQRKVTRSPKGRESSCSCSCFSRSRSRSRCRCQDQDQRLSPACGARAHLSLLVQRNMAQRGASSTAEWLVKHTLPPRPRRCATRVHSAGRIFRRDIHVSSKNDAHPCASPRSGSCLPAPSLRKGPGKSKAEEPKPKPKQKPKPKPKLWSRSALTPTPLPQAGEGLVH